MALESLSLQNKMPQQITLDIELPDEQTFSTFVVGDNQLIVEHCTEILQPNITKPFLTYISGASGTGKSHLLVAICQSADTAGLNHFYLDLSSEVTFPAEILHGMEHLDILCIDNIQHLAGDLTWQIALFDLINRIQESNHCKLVVSADQGPIALNLQLPDLQSRLSWGVSFHLGSLDDDDMLTVLLLKAQHRGIKVGKESMQFLLSHFQRDMHSLTKALTELQSKSLELKRKISVPLIKQVFDF